MGFEKASLLDLLETTPIRVKTIVTALPESMIDYKPEEDHFSIRDIIGHLIHGEDDDWIPRLQLMLDYDQKGKGLPTFKSFDRFAHQKFIDQYTISQMVDLFEKKRGENIDTLQGIELNDEQLKIEGIHPSLGKVNVEWLLNCWISHDLSHLNQMNRILVSKFDDVGPWKEYLRILNE